MATAKVSTTLGKRMYAMLEGNQRLDMDFIVGPNEIRIPAHQLILSSTSDVFATKFSENWKTFESEGNRPTTIKLPSNTEEGVKAFIKGIYRDDLDPELSIDVLTELLLLSHAFMMEHLVKTCENAIIERITVDNCLTLIEIPNLYAVSKCVAKKARRCFMNTSPYLLGMSGYKPQLGTSGTNHSTASNSNSSKPCPSSSKNWSAGTWKNVLGLSGGSIRNIKEETLFEQLVRWRRRDPFRRQVQFINLTKLVRFPLMAPSFIVNNVIPTNVLTDKEVTDLMCQIHGKGQKNARTSRFISQRRT